MASALRASLAIRSLVARPILGNYLSRTGLLFNSTLSTTNRTVRTLTQFEDKCQRNELVAHKDFVRTLDLFANSISEDTAREFTDLSIYSNMLLRCCGRLMFDTTPDKRELLAGKLWSLLKEKKVPIDVSHYNSLIRVLNENLSKYDPQSILDEMKTANLNPDMITYQRLIHQYCLQGNIEGATKLLETMKNLGFELSESVFASLIIGYGKQENPPAIKEMFNLMRSNNVEPNSKSFAAAFISLGERFEKNPEAIEEFNELLELFKREEIQLNLADVIDLIIHLSPHKKTSEALNQFLEDLSVSQLGAPKARYRILSTLIRVGQLELASKLFWSQKVGDKALQSGNHGSYWIKALVAHKNVPVEFAIKECEQLRLKGYNIKAFHQLYFLSAEIGRLDLVRESLKKIAEEEPIKAPYVWPLLVQAKDENEIIHALKNDLSPQMDTNDLIDTFSQWVFPRYSDNIEQLFELNKKELGYDGNILMTAYLNYAVREDKIMDAIKFISDAPNELVDEDSNKPDGDDDIADGGATITPRLRVADRSGRNNLVSRLLTQIAEQTKDPELLKKAFNMCNLPTQQVSLRSLNALVKVHLLNDDIKGALEQFFKCAAEYRMTPCRTDLMVHCLNNKNPEDLQKIMNTVTELFGESNALFDLAVCCLKCNKLKQAQKIFASPGFRVNPIRVYATCRSLARVGDINVLENFVNLSRDMYDINQEILYQILLDTYERTSNAKRALHLWNMMQEEEFQPSKQSLIMIADILEKNNIEVPFQRPRVVGRMQRK